MEQVADVGGSSSLQMSKLWKRLEEFKPLRKAELDARADAALRDHRLNCIRLFGDGEVQSEEAPPPAATEAGADAVFMFDGILTGQQCDAVRKAVAAAVGRRGGWCKSRHGRHPTTDLPLEDVPEMEAMIRESVFCKLLRPMVPFYLGETFLPEHLVVHDLFFVYYSAAEGEQNGLEVHMDGSVFSFNILLSDPADFDGGGTFFEAPGATVRSRQGSALVHGGDLRHGGNPITRGERYLLVGFVTVDHCARTAPYCVADSARAACAAFRKFGAGAFDRSPIGSVVEDHRLDMQTISSLATDSERPTVGQPP